MTTAALAPIAGLAPGRYEIDPGHSEVTFTIRHLVSKVRGSFTEFSGELTVSEELGLSSATAEIKMASVNTRNSQRDDDLRSGNIFGAEQYPLMTFRSTGVRAGSSQGEYLVDGELTIREVTKPVTLTVEYHGTDADPWGGTRAGFTATTAIVRKDFGIDFNVPLQGDKVLLGDKVDVLIEIEAIRK
jgi:polyisoprenoid-binding protein YceI